MSNAIVESPASQNLRAPRRESELRVELITAMLERRMALPTIREAFEHRFNMPGTSDAFRRAYKSAMEALVSRVNAPRDEHRALSMAFLESIIRSRGLKGGAKTTDAIKAQQVLNQLLGLDERNTGSSGNVLPTIEVVVTSQSEVRKFDEFKQLLTVQAQQLADKPALIEYDYQSRETTAPLDARAQQAPPAFEGAALAIASVDVEW